MNKIHKRDFKDNFKNWIFELLLRPITHVIVEIHYEVFKVVIF